MDIASKWHYLTVYGLFQDGRFRNNELLSPQVKLTKPSREDSVLLLAHSHVSSVLFSHPQTSIFRATRLEERHFGIVVSPQSSVVVGPFQPPPDVGLQSYKA